MTKDEPITLIGKNKLQAELDQLIKVEREAIKKDIAEARAQGDLKENAEYQFAKEKQSSIEGRILELQSALSTSNVIDPNTIKNEKIVFSATVTLYDSTKDKEVKYQIVGVNESKEDGKISYNSPLGKALIGKEEGDEVSFKAPKGEVEYEIVSVEYR